MAFMEFVVFVEVYLKAGTLNLFWKFETFFFSLFLAAAFLESAEFVEVSFIAGT